MRVTHLLAAIRDVDFESAWIYAIVIFGMTVLSAWALWAVVRPLPSMWRRGHHMLGGWMLVFLLFAFLMLGSILATVAFTMIRIAAGPGGSS